jgi:hypothetical protein
VPEALRVAKEFLERGARILTAEAVEVEVPLHREIAALQAREVPPAFPCRCPFDALARGERVDLAPPGDEVRKRGEGLGVVVSAPGKRDGPGKPQGLRAPA